MKHILPTLLCAALVLSGCAGSKFVPGTATSFPKANQKGKTAIVAHRGYWNCEAAGYMENTIASLKAAQDNGLWGSEFDIHLTSDDVVLVNHNDNIQGVKIAENPLSVFKAMTHKNGEHPSTLDEYLTQGEKCATTVLVIELKPQKGVDREDLLWQKTVEALKAHQLYDPKRVAFISFSHHICQKIAAEAPQFINQYLEGDIAPEVLATEGINGIDYEQKVFIENPDYVQAAHDKGMTVNAWTVNKDHNMRSLIYLGIDALTTNEPLLARKVLGDREFKLAK
jgi:glycerophosphoryl diester phosphodiesterase